MSAVYHLTWNDIEVMPFAELSAYRKAYPEVRTAMRRVEPVRYEGT